MIKDFIEQDEIIVNKNVFKTHFTCDLEKCKGACCTMHSDYGAPILQKEIEVIEQILETVHEYLPTKSKREIERNGFWGNHDDQLMLTSIDKRDCVFVFHENNIAKCAFEKAYFEGKIDFRKPISCHLFPIRVSEFGGPVLRFEKYRECEPALAKGKETKINVVKFCREALDRAFGEEWTNNILHDHKDSTNVSS